MAALRIGVVGLGGIAQKAWLPVLGAATDWTLAAAWSPTREKAQRVCDTWRIPYVGSLGELAAQCDSYFWLRVLSLNLCKSS
ncbi:Gfo/Idh/MocA family oxidoreductase [Herbaspirillum sp. VT-16-41]|uniref:Gfo/Idh/MocA family oxidoreductase n=1 Tax=Herbaspirillum sp. VT-16-41 TaxID=1953765 RepID=UPI001C2BF3E9